MSFCVSLLHRSNSATSASLAGAAKRNMSAPVESVSSSSRRLLHPQRCRRRWLCLKHAKQRRRVSHSYKACSTLRLDLALFCQLSAAPERAQRLNHAGAEHFACLRVSIQPCQRACLSARRAPRAAVRHGRRRAQLTTGQERCCVLRGARSRRAHCTLPHQLADEWAV